MKKVLLIMIMTTLSCSLALAQNLNRPLGFSSNMISVSLSGGAVIHATGKYDAALELSDLLETGPTFVGSLTYSASPILSIRGTFDFAYNYFESKYRSEGKKPSFVMPAITADAIFKLGPLIEGNDAGNPYIFAGAGIYFWKFSNDKIDGDAMSSINGKEWKATSFGLHAGTGFEVYIIPSLAFFAEGQYRFIFSKQTDDFGNDFENLGFFKFSGGVTYYF